MWRHLIDLIYPPEPAPIQVFPVEFPFCRLCGEPVAGAVDSPFQCSNCRDRRWFLVSARAGYRAEGDVLEWIHHCKYRSHWHRLPQLGCWLFDGFERFYGDQTFDGMVPVPLHPRRFRSRGFNQARELARHLSRLTGVPVWCCLQRVRYTTVQASLNRTERLKNCQKAFCLNGDFEISGARILLIDDVLTTGATVNECARVLKAAGARECRVLTVARGGNA